MSARTVSTHAACAKAIRTELKTHWPDMKFKVTSQTYANGNSVHIHVPENFGYQNRDVLYQLVQKYEYGTSDPLTDSYVMSNVRHDVPQVKFVHIH